MKEENIIRKAIRKTGAKQYYYTLNQNFRSRYEHLLLNLSPSRFFRYRYKRFLHKKLDLAHPTAYNEKLIWMNLYWKHPLKAECADKYTMRAYVQNHGYSSILPGLIGVYNDSSEIDFNALPQRFVLKCNHGCGFNIVCTNKNDLNIPQAKQLLDSWLRIDYSKNAGELHYAAITPRIICEEFLEGPNGSKPIDYKIPCFNGKAQYVLVATDRDETGHTNKYDYYDLQWNKMPFIKTSLNTDRFTPKPETLDEMVKIAEDLSKPFPFVRMDFYDIHGKPFLGEMTFTPAGCLSPGLTEEAQGLFGSMITLPAPMPKSRFAR